MMMPHALPAQASPLLQRLHALTRKSEMIASTIIGKVAEMERRGLPWGKSAQGLSVQAMASLEVARDAANETEQFLVDLNTPTPEAQGVEEALQELRGALGRLKQRLGLLLLQELTAPTAFRSAPHGETCTPAQARLRAEALHLGCFSD